MNRMPPRSFSIYVDDTGKEWYDLQLAMNSKKDLNDNGLMVQVKPGDVDLTNWRKIRNGFPFSYLRIGEMEPIALINFKGTTMLDHSETYTLYIEFKLNI